ncbi:MAG: response regulator [Campylobacterales bacterium]|nr:response regulator [Campylobacterales bacterium]
MIDYTLLEKYSKDISVLFVEDDINLRKEMYSLLEDIFLNVDLAVDGEDGFNKYNLYYEKYENFYDLVISDIQMPKVNGVELTKLIYSKNSDQNIVILTAHKDTKYLLELINMGVCQYINKPIDINSFFKVIYTVSEDIYNIKKQSKDLSNIIHISSKLTWNKLENVLQENKIIIKLSKKETLLISLLLKNEIKFCTVDNLLLYIWKDDDIEVNVSNLKNIISKLKKKVPSLNILNSYNYGYKLLLS